ncbi:MAG: glycosyltransferase [Eggerthellaceae bacterium]|nr:glycosyltransferase [Eggerthellaceae bacterium]
MLLAAAETDGESPVVMVVHASVGSGHRSAANAIAQAFEMLRNDGDPAIPSSLEVEVLDILDWGRIKFDGDKTASLFTGFTRPIYDLTWRYTFTGRLLWGGGTIWSRIMFPAFTEHVRKRKPLAIICTHITAANVAVGARMLTAQNFPIVCVPTDYETEGLWPHLHSDLFCVASESMAETLRPRKVPEERILITGIPTREDFRRTYDVAEIRTQLGLPIDKNLVLALAGAYLPRPYVHFREALDKALPYVHTFDNLHLAIVAGQDGEYASHLREEVKEMGLENVTVFGYVDQMASLMAASNLVICKSGGLTVTECLCAQVPMILLGKAYGQENINVRTLTGLGAALHVTTTRELVDTLRHISRNPESLRAMLINGSFLRKPDAARDIAHAALRLAEHPEPASDPTRRKHFLHFYWGRKPAHIR